MPYRPHRNQRERKRVRNADAQAVKDQVKRLPYCVDCGSSSDLTADHLVAVSKGGTAATGLTTRCGRCNRRRGVG